MILKRSKRLNPNAIGIEEKAVTPNSFRIPFENPTFISQQDEAINNTAPNVYPGPTEGAPSFISQEVNSANDIEAIKKVKSKCNWH